MMAEGERLTAEGEEMTNRPTDGLVPLEAILRTEELSRRPSRPPDHEQENRALVALARALTGSPHTILQGLSDTLLEDFKAGSAGISLLTEDGTAFYWPAISGEWKQHLGGGTPRDFGPCGDVLDQDAPLLFTHFERRYPYLQPVTPPAEECLLVPLYVEGKAVGTIWVIAHDDRRHFDAEDLRRLVSMAAFASAAYQMAELHERTLAINQALVIGSVRQHELAEAADAANADLAAADKAKAHFLAMLSHELRSPLNIMRLWSQIIVRPGTTGADLRVGLQAIDRASKAQAQLVEDLLDVHRLGSGRMRLDLESVDLGEILGSVIDSTAPSATEREVRLHREIDRAPVFISGDPARLQQILGNVLGNAVKFTPKGGEIRIGLRRSLTRAEVTISDTGEGISAVALPHIFDRFRQADPLLSHTHGGLGLGLSIARQLVELHAGTITAESPGKGEGATFLISFPLVSGKGATHRSRSPAKHRTKERSPLLGGILVMVVDDEPDSREVVRRILEEEGAETIAVGSTAEALSLFRQQQPDLILSDIVMPGRDGYDLVRSIRALPPERGGLVPAIALTACVTAEDRVRARKAGFQTHLAKPAEAEDLVAAVAALVSRAPSGSGGGTHE